jgi:hypothetical protein
LFLNPTDRRRSTLLIMTTSDNPHHQPRPAMQKAPVAPFKAPMAL